MSTQQSFVDFILDELYSLNSIRYRKMFGEYAIYYNDKVVALCCDNKLFIKPTNSGEDFIKNYYKKDNSIKFGNPYSESKLWILIEEEIEDSEFLTELIKITEMELPKAKVKSKVKTIKDNKGKANN